MGFLSDSPKYSALATKESYDEILLAMYLLTNKSRHLARTKFANVAMMSGKIRMAREKSFEENQDGIYNSARTIIENAKLCKFLNQYLSRTDPKGADEEDRTPVMNKVLNKIKTLTAYLCFTGFVYRNYDSIQFPKNVFIHNNGSKDDLSIHDVIAEMYEAMMEKSAVLFENFYKKYPLLKKHESLGRSDYLIKRDFHSNMRERINNLDTQYDKSQLITDITTLGTDVTKNQSMELNELYSKLDLSSSTYDRLKTKVFMELIDMLPSAESNYLLMEFN